MPRQRNYRQEYERRVERQAEMREALGLSKVSARQAAGHRGGGLSNKNVRQVYEAKYGSERQQLATRHALNKEYGKTQRKDLPDDLVRTLHRLFGREWAKVLYGYHN